jgi:hypothetical protein
MIRSDHDTILNLTEAIIRLTAEGEKRRADNAKCLRDEMLRYVYKYDKSEGRAISAEVKAMEVKNV